MGQSIERSFKYILIIIGAHYKYTAQINGVADIGVHYKSTAQINGVADIGVHYRQVYSTD